jgi:hypothetical protein
MGRAKLWIAITVVNDKGQETSHAYALTYLNPYPEATPAWRLTKTDDSSYDVALTEHGPVCSCPDFLYARDGHDEKGCKHVASLRAVGLLRREPVAHA